MKQTSFLKINPADSVVVCLRPMQKGETITIDGKDIEVNVPKYKMLLNLSRNSLRF